MGSVATALFAAAAARRAGGELLLRVEDLDGPRVVAGAEASQLADLDWLGIRFDGPTVRQSERAAHHEAALERLAAAGHTYLCDCSRADIARVASAPHEGDEGPRYPGTCRAFGMADRSFKRAPAVRLSIPGRVITYEDAVRGRVVTDVLRSAGDFVLRRGDGVFAYQLAVVVDDLAMGVTEVVRGADLVSSAPRQALIAELLGGRAPRYAHVPLLVGADGARLAKRSGGMTVGELRERGVAAGDLLRRIAELYGHPIPASSDPVAALAAVYDPARWAGDRVRWTGLA